MKQPVLFIGHGSPMKAIEKSAWGDRLSQLSSEIPKPEAILIVSAHWMTKGTKVCAVAQPKTTHDFYGFPQELFDVQYPAIGSPEFAKKTCQLLGNFRAEEVQDWGLDHGAWSILLHLFPKADIPCFQLSMDQALGERAQYEVGRALQELREEGVLILGSGNIVHNLRKLNWTEPHPKPHPWCVQFDENIQKAIDAKNDNDILAHRNLWPEISQLAHPTDEHLRPLFYCLGARERDEKPEIIFADLEMASLSMRSWRFG